MTERSKTMSLPPLIGDVRLLVYLFVGFRLIMAMVYQPYVFEVYEPDDGEYTPTTLERGMSTFGDLPSKSYGIQHLITLCCHELQRIGQFFQKTRIGKFHSSLYNLLYAILPNDYKRFSPFLFPESQDQGR